jgi:hypothetical protein
MARHSLRIVIVLGVLITLVGGTGIFATFSDRATTGQSDIVSGALGKAADLMIADGQPLDPMNSGPIGCGGFTDDLVTPLFVYTSQLGSQAEHFFCLQNQGSSAVDLSLTAIDITDLDVDCTGDEATFGDNTCGIAVAGAPNGGLPQQGELSPNLTIETDLYDCMTGAGLLTPGVPDFSSSLADLGTTPEALLPATGITNLTPGSEVCVRLRVSWSATGDAAQISQSDEATWKFAFDASVP